MTVINVGKHAVRNVSSTKHILVQTDPRAKHHQRIKGQVMQARPSQPSSICKLQINLRSVSYLQARYNLRIYLIPSLTINTRANPSDVENPLFISITSTIINEITMYSVLFCRCVSIVKF